MCHLCAVWSSHIIEWNISAYLPNYTTSQLKECHPVICFISQTSEKKYCTCEKIIFRLWQIYMFSAYLNMENLFGNVVCLYLRQYICVPHQSLNGCLNFTHIWYLSFYPQQVSSWCTWTFQFQKYTPLTQAPKCEIVIFFKRFLTFLIK